MLLYYFKDKDEFLAAVLHCVAARVVDRLDKAIPNAKPKPIDRLLGEVWEILTSEDVRPLMPLWMDLASGAARGLQPHLTISGQIANKLPAWAASNLKVLSGHNQATEPALFTVAIEGMSMLDAIGRPNLSTSAASQSKKEMRTRAAPRASRTV